MILDSETGYPAEASPLTGATHESRSGLRCARMKEGDVFGKPDGIALLFEDGGTFLTVGTNRGIEAEKPRFQMECTVRLFR